MLRRRAHRRPLGFAAALAVAAGVLASGCAQGTPGAAATVGGESISTGKLSETVEAVERAVQQRGMGNVRDRAGLVRVELSRMINTAVLRVAAREADITVTRAQVQQTLQQLGGRQQAQQQALRQFGVPPGELHSYIRTQVMRQQLAESLAPEGNREELSSALQDKLRQTAGELGVNVNPRYGRFSPQQLSVVPAGSELSSPESSPGQATPSPQAGQQ